MTTHIHTKSKGEAWSKAADLMPCDYIHDGIRSKRAGYNVFYSTCDTVDAWVSDLGNRLKVNLPNGDTLVFCDMNGTQYDLIERIGEDTALICKRKETPHD